jgi:hypothetical protein
VAERLAGPAVVLFAEFAGGGGRSGTGLHRRAEARELTVRQARAREGRGAIRATRSTARRQSSSGANAGARAFGANDHAGRRGAGRALGGRGSSPTAPIETALPGG